MQAFWRLTIMLGTLTVGGMAAYVYGPPPERVIELADQLYTRARQALDEQRERPPRPAFGDETLASRGGLSFPAAGLPAPGVAAPVISQPLPPSSPPPTAWPAPAAVATSPAPSTPGPGIDPMTDELRRLGATDFQLKPWGDGRLHRFCCTAELAGGSGIRRHFQAIQPTPSQAVAAALAEVRRWRSGSTL
ncbi:MAG: hypothetical protein AAGJ46_11905 [Planctomycetota bacterium]